MGIKLSALAYVLGGAALVLNPTACVVAETPFMFGVAEMKAAIEGTWEITPNGGTPQKFRIEQRKETQSSRATGLVSDAAACSSRTFIASASACVDTTSMPVVLVALDDVTKSLAGQFYVDGKRFIEGHLHVQLGNDGIRATISPAGEVIRADNATLVKYR